MPTRLIPRLRFALGALLAGTLCILSTWSPTRADLVIFNPERKMTISAATQHQHVDYTPYEGMQVQGVPETILLRGGVIVRDGEYVGGKGGGQYLRRATFSEELTEG